MTQRRLVDYIREHRAELITRAAPPRLTSGKIPLAITLAVIVFVYALWQNLIGGTGEPALRAGSPATSTPQTIVVQDAPTAATTSPGVPQMNIAPTSGNVGSGTAGLYADGSYTGISADAYYGTVQVEAIIRDGKVADVQFVQYPDDRSTSRLINEQAMPVLVQEAIAAQSAQVDTASGATFTSDAFRESLSSALALAKN